ncbi:MAG: hypothetical protein H7172_07800, partial [Ferruginibacter sp.]|nr:hypothetical protein [Rhodoferax sp.]
MLPALAAGGSSFVDAIQQGRSLLGMRAGARNILIPNPRDQTAMIGLLKPYKLHMFPAVNTLFGALL